MDKLETKAHDVLWNAVFGYTGSDDDTTDRTVSAILNGLEEAGISFATYDLAEQFAENAKNPNLQEKPTGSSPLLDAAERERGYEIEVESLKRAIEVLREGCVDAAERVERLQEMLKAFMWAYDQRGCVSPEEARRARALLAETADGGNNG